MATKAVTLDCGCVVSRDLDKVRYCPESWLLMNEAHASYQRRDPDWIEVGRRGGEHEAEGWRRLGPREVTK